MLNSLQIKETDQTYYAKTYARSDLCIASGTNATCLSADGKKYIDFSSGIGVNSLGYSDPQWAQAVAEQAKKLSHTSNLYYNEPSATLVNQGIISGGMIPKIQCCVEAVRRGVNRTFIIDGRIPHSILIEMLSNEGIGTMFC